MLVTCIVLISSLRERTEPPKITSNQKTNRLAAGTSGQFGPAEIGLHADCDANKRSAKRLGQMAEVLNVLVELRVPDAKVITAKVQARTAPGHHVEIATPSKKECRRPYRCGNPETLDRYEPPAEMATAGHDRCIINLRSGNVCVWLRPAGSAASAL